MLLGAIESIENKKTIQMFRYRFWVESEERVPRYHAKIRGSGERFGLEADYNRAKVFIMNK